LRFAVRRPATRPASPRGHRPPGGDVLALRAGPSRRLAARDDFTDASPAERTWNTGARDLPPHGRVALARVLLGPAKAGLDPYFGVASPAGRSWDRRPAPVTPAPARSALAGVLTGTADGARAENAVAPGPVARLLSADAATAELEPTAPVVAGEVPQVLTPTRVMSGRPVTCPSGETAHRLGETTDGLLLRHLRTRPAKDAPGPAAPLGLNGPARPPMLDAPSTTTEIPRRERRLLPGRKAGASTPRTR
jgi:hypothetical protein